MHDYLSHLLKCHSQSLIGGQPSHMPSSNLSSWIFTAEALVQSEKSDHVITR